MSRATSRALTGSPPHANVLASFFGRGGDRSGRRMARARGTSNITLDDFSGDLVRHRPSLERSARRLCRNRQDAEDLIQTTLERAWQARAQFMPGGNIGGWLFRILCNRHRDNLRRRSAMQVPLPDDVPDSPPEAEEISSLLSISPETALEALSQLPPELR